MTLSGGTIIVPYTKTSGPSIPGLSDSYNITYTVSDLTPRAGNNNDYVWYQPTVNASISSLGYVGTEYDITSLLTNLPANNLESVIGDDISPTADGSFDGWFRKKQENGTLDTLGSFTVSTSVAPIAPLGYELLSDNVSYFSFFNAVKPEGSQSYQQGVWAAPQGSAIQTGGYANSNLLIMKHGQTAIFDFTSFDDPGTDSAITQNGRAFWNAIGSMTYQPVPEPASALLAGGFLLMLQMRRRR